MSDAPVIDFSPLHERADAGVLVALSGGLDSTVLLHLLAAQPYVRDCGLRALHVHHGLHAEADRWQVHCEAECSRLGIPLACVHVDVRPAGDGPEAAARLARHAAFEASLPPGQLLAVGHHRDDQAETFVLRALRASGPDGLGAMRPLRPFGRGWMWRPLLGVPRESLRRYAMTHALTWVDDPSNRDDSFDRNFLRNRVMPLLHQRWPHADAALSRSAALCADTAGLLDDDDASALASARTSNADVLDLDALQRFDASRQARVLRRWITSLGLPPMPADALRRFHAELLPAAVDAQPEIAWAGARVRRWRRLLHADRPGAPWRLECPLEWSGEVVAQLPLGDTLELRPVRRLPWTARIRSRDGGERIRLPGREHDHRLKHALQDVGMPSWDRDRLPLLVDEADEVLAAGEIVSARLADWLAETGTRLVWRRGAAR